ncbi:MAG: hypothetical protein CMJ32_00045 [Phycisphaerae bacterium]|nr:hypothetical protein [Phycisphaerae bacterium]
MATVGEKKRRKRERREMEEQFGLGQTKRAPRRGRPPRSTDIDTQNVVLAARCRQQGRRATVKDMLAVKEAINSSLIGLAIKATLTPEEAMEAWDAFVHYDHDCRRFEMLVLNRQSSPKSATLEMMPDRMETDPSASVDDRTEEERHRAAVNKRDAWRSHLGTLGEPGAGLIREARHRPPETWWDTHTATPTRKGRILARALYDLADIAD